MSTVDLQAQLANITETLSPDMPLFWGLIGDMQEFCPPIWDTRKKGKTVKAARLAFVSEMVGRKVESFNDLWGKELFLIDEWFYAHLQDYVDWCAKNAEKIKSLV